MKRNVICSLVGKNLPPSSFVNSITTTPLANCLLQHRIRSYSSDTKLSDLFAELSKESAKFQGKENEEGEDQSNVGKEDGKEEGKDKGAQSIAATLDILAKIIGSKPKPQEVVDQDETFASASDFNRRIGHAKERADLQTRKLTLEDLKYFKLYPKKVKQWIIDCKTPKGTVLHRWKALVHPLPP